VLSTTATTTETDVAASVIPAIELRGLRKSYGQGDSAVDAVKQLDITIREGEFFSLLGPSGCGKSTTLRMIAGLEDATDGEIWLHGREVTDVAPHRREVNTVFQNYALFPHLSVRDNIAFGLKRKHLGKAEIASRVDEVIAVMELGGRERRMPRELSGGQQQRVALARALVNRPRALLLDEPLGALDLQLRQNMQIELKRIQREAGITFIYVTHDQSEALTMSDRVAVMNGGRIEQCAPPAEIYDRPLTPFVAQFIGTSNLMTMSTTALAGDEFVATMSADERVVLPAIAGHRVGEAMTFAVRPEKIAIGVVPPDSGTRVRGVVDEVVYLGTSTSYLIRTSILEATVVFEKNGATTESYNRGDSVWLSWPVSSVRTFPSL
jgi:spermidine/putrescine transport system ATP-binding protein